MNKKAMAVGALLFAAAMAAAQDGGFQIRGVRLGKAPADVCAGTEIKTGSADLSSPLPESVSSCSGAVSEMAGTAVYEPSSMAFVSDRLVAFRLSVGPMSFETLAAVHQALQSEYGRPKVERTSAGSTFTWRSAGQTLLQERSSLDLDDNYLTLLLTDDKGVARYRALMQRRINALRELERREVRDAVLN